MNKIKQFCINQLPLLVILSCVSIYIFVHSYFFGYFISWDSTHYLRAAQSILNGNGMFTHPTWSHFYGDGYFAIWPIGYPLLIAFVAFLTGTEVYLASRILAVLLVWAIGISFAHYFGKRAWIFALVLLNVGFLRIFYFPWSETSYILMLILLSFWTSDILLAKTVRKRQYIKLTFAATFLFLSRYVGAFSIGIIGLLWLWNLYLHFTEKEELAKKRTFYLTISGAFTGLFMLGYLLLNCHMTGFITGSPNHPREGFFYTLNMLYDASLIEVNNLFGHFFSISNFALPLLLLAFLFVIYVPFRYKNALKNAQKELIIPLIFLLMGLFSWCAIVAMRFLSRFDPFNFRLLAPSSILFSIGLIGLILFCLKREKEGPVRMYPVRQVLISLALGALLFSSLMPIFQTENRSGYREMHTEVVAMHAHIPDGAAVVWGNHYLLYLREDLAFTFDLPMRLPAAMDVDGFFNYHADFSAIFLDVRGMHNHLDRTFPDNPEMQAFFRQFWYEENRFIQIR